MFPYVVETERRFYLANQVKLDVRTEDGRTYFELELQRRVGLGHVPPDALRRQRAGRDVQGRQHRGARPRTTLSVRPPAPAAALGAARRGRWSPRWYEADGYAVLDRNWRCREGELDLVARASGARSCSAR